MILSCVLCIMTKQVNTDKLKRLINSYLTLIGNLMNIELNYTIKILCNLSFWPVSTVALIMRQCGFYPVNRPYCIVVCYWPRTSLKSFQKHQNKIFCDLFKKVFLRIVHSSSIYYAVSTCSTAMKDKQQTYLKHNMCLYKLQLCGILVAC
jgi:hypothetical protein